MQWRVHPSNFATYNRTKLELKYSQKISPDQPVKPYNRTKLELKFDHKRATQVVSSPYNRTKLELKFVS